jgi:hypothetical protein
MTVDEFVDQTGQITLVFRRPLPNKGRHRYDAKRLFLVGSATAAFGVLTVPATVRKLVFGRFWMLFGATDAPVVNRLRPGV